MSGIQKIQLSNSVYLSRQARDTNQEDVGIFASSNDANLLTDLFGDGVDGIVGAFAHLSTEMSGDYTSLESAISAEVVARSDADAILTSSISTAVSYGDAAVSAEVVARSDADAVLATDLSTELVARASAVTAEESARIAGDATLSTNISTELVARASAVTAEESARIAGDALLTTALSAEASSRLDVDQKLTQLVTGISMGETQISSLTVLLDLYDNAPYDVIKGVVTNQNTTNTILNVLHDLLPDAASNYSLPVEISVYTSV